MTEPFTLLTSRVVPLPIDNIDTDQIIPARFLKTIDKAGLSANLFCDWRYKVDGTPDPDFVLNRPENQGAQILLAGNNFACGSSREHAPWALASYGFRVVIAGSFADIFRNNALKNGLLPVALEAEAYHQLRERMAADPQTMLTVDLANQAVVLPDEESFSFSIDPFSKACLLKGTDELGYLMAFDEQIRDYERREA